MSPQYVITLALNQLEMGRDPRGVIWSAVWQGIRIGKMEERSMNKDLEENPALRLAKPDTGPKTKGLTLKEAIDSGRPFKHKDWNVFYETLGTICTISRAISSDWEIKPEPKKPMKIEFMTDRVEGPLMPDSRMYGHKWFIIATEVLEMNYEQQQNEASKKLSELPKERKQPRVIEFEGTWNMSDRLGWIGPGEPDSTLRPLVTGRWRTVCTEVLDE